MMGHQARSEALFYYFRLEDQIPETHLLRLIDKHISFDFVREQLKASYSETGRPSIDPEQAGTEYAPPRNIAHEGRLQIPEAAGMLRGALREPANSFHLYPTIRVQFNYPRSAIHDMGN